MNLFLEVTSKRPDGFHELVTVIHEIDLCDSMEVTLCPGSEDRLVLQGNSLSCPPEENLVMKAVRAFRELCPGLPALEIFLHKLPEL